MPTLTRADTLEPKRNAHTLVFTTHERAGEAGAADPHAGFDDRVARAIGRVLHQHYQGHDWNVWVSREIGIAKIWLSCLMNPQYPYVLHLAALRPEDVMRAGGEILERFGLPRSAVDFGLVKATRQKLGPLATRMRPPGGLGKLA
jgi:hypothetical protein